MYIEMKRVKCYGRAQVTTIDSSFKRNFFGSLDCTNFVESNCFQEFQQKGSSSFTSVSSTSEYSDIDTHELFASDTNSWDESLPTCSPCSSKNVGRKHRFKFSVSKKSCSRRKFSCESTSDSFINLQPLSTSKAKKTLKKHTRASKSRSVKQIISKKFKLPVKVTSPYSSHTDLGLSCKKTRNVTCLKLYKKSTLKRNHKTRKRHSLDKHSSIPIQSSLYFCKNPSSIINTDMKKKNKKYGNKKLQLINKDCDIPAPYCFNINMTSSFNSKNDSFWAAIQPRWSSICAHSFEIEKALRERDFSMFIESHANKNTSFLDLTGKENELLSKKGSISGEIHVQSKGSNSCKHLAVEKNKNTDKFDIVRNDGFLNRGRNLNVNSSETIEGKLNAAINVSVNGILNEKSANVIDTDFIIGHTLPEINIFDIQQRGDKRAPNSCKNVSEKLNVNEIVAVNKDENTSKSESVKTCKETKLKMNDKHFISSLQTNFTSSKIISENKDILKKNKENDCLSENADQLQEYVFDTYKKNKSFYSSTPLTSSTHITAVKDFAKVLSPVVRKDLFATRSLIHSPKLLSSQQNQIYNVSTSRLGRQCISLQDLRIVSSVKLQEYQSTKMSTSLLSKRNHVSFISNSTYRNQNAHNYSSKSYIFSEREHSVIGESHCSFKKVTDSLVASTSVENNLKPTLSKLLGFCGQTSIMPFNELYDWSHTTVRKIGEGTYGEVFTLVQKKISSVIKVIPFSEDNEDHSMQCIETVLSEVTVSQCLSELRNNKNYKTRNFNKLKSVHLVSGCYPYQMIAAWDKYSDEKTTYNSRPDIFNDQQMFAIIELEYGGKDMSCFMLRNAVEAESILKQIAISLAIAEETHLFEHRDLHLGNILVQRNGSKKISYVIGGKPFSIPNHGLVVTIIDFTLSRILHEDCVLYNNLGDDDSLFDQTGDYQFQVYKDTKLLLNNEWHKCLLYSNVLWLTYLCMKLSECNYSRPSSKKHEESLKNIKTFRNQLSTCQKAFECLTTCNILSSVPKNEQGSAKKMAIKAKFVDRKSLRNTLSRRTSNVA